MKDTSYTRGTKRVEIEEPEAHWAWGVCGALIACVLLSWMAAWIIEGIAK